MGDGLDCGQNPALDFGFIRLLTPTAMFGTDGLGRFGTHEWLGLHDHLTGGYLIDLHLDTGLDGSLHIDAHVESHLLVCADNLNHIVDILGILCLEFCGDVIGGVLLCSVCVVGNELGILDLIAATEEHIADILMVIHCGSLQFFRQHFRNGLHIVDKCILRIHHMDPDILFRLHGQIRSLDDAAVTVNNHMVDPAGNGNRVTAVRCRGHAFTGPCGKGIIAAIGPCPAARILPIFGNNGADRNVRHRLRRRFRRGLRSRGSRGLSGCHIRRAATGAQRQTQCQCQKHANPSFHFFSSFCFQKPPCNKLQGGCFYTVLEKHFAANNQTKKHLLSGCGSVPVCESIVSHFQEYFKPHFNFSESSFTGFPS